MRFLPLLLLSMLLGGCRKEPDRYVDIAIDVQDPVVTIAADSSRDVAVTLTFTQLGNYFLTDAWMFVYRQSGNSDTLAVHYAQLPTAREFVPWNFKLPGKGLYMIQAGLYADLSGTVVYHPVFIP